MSIKGRIECAKAEVDRNRLAREKAEKRAAKKAKEFFRPIYEAFLEIEKEYGSGRGLEISAADYMCRIRAEKGLDKLELSCFSFAPDKISFEEINDFSNVPDPEIIETRRELGSTEEAIDLAIKYIAEHIK